MNQYKQFQNALVLNEFDKGCNYELDNRYFVGKTPHGGYLNALMHKALISKLPHSSAISSSVQYLDRIDEGEVYIYVEVFKISRGSSSGIVKIIQDDRICCTFTGTCTDLDVIDGFNDLETPIPQLFNTPNHEDYIKLNYDVISKGFTPSFIKQLKCVIHPDHAWWNRSISIEDSEARCSAILEMEGGIPDQFCLSFYADILPPVVTNKYGALGWVPTITLTTFIRQLPTTKRVFADFKARDINKGYFEQDCNIWDLNGNLVASSRQLTRILKSEEKLKEKGIIK